MDEPILTVVMELQAALEKIQEAKAAGGIGDQRLDPRCLAIAATHLETAMLWVANAWQ